LKILLLKPSSLGDVIHALPVLRLLKSHLPRSQIYWWLDVNLVPLLEQDPDLTGIFPFQRNRWAALHRWPEIAASLRTMRQKRFDWAIDLQGLARSGLFAWLSNARLTVGLNNLREGQREGARAFYDLTPPSAPPRTHAVDRYMAVLPLLGVPTHWNFDWLPSRQEVRAQILKKWNPADTPWVALLPGGRWDNKRWPVEYFVELVKLMRAREDLRFVILGSASERPLGQAIEAIDPTRCLNLAGQTSLWEMIEWIRLCRLTVTNDTGPMHVAAALKKPLVALFGPTNPCNTGPYGDLENVIQITRLPCVPCMKATCSYADPLACLRQITPAMVFEKVRQQMG
jgi:heptosyltransferase I